ncbi:geranylgeranylglycerol-phosphate geranylgeranyltransferase [Salinarchaeum sp. IM2453]|uniref:geranylgeranylglycerol-phosphate geranylgeranyltransferase n=1 Tax=Salinarchaeum sp. IM2453 TaxID=2862870 RepID=UPI001C8392AF|nr:geranylgeranylglycerol-phosphate geranylgeranyltransferase [Salinarchaeum sp. IM2453]QZA88408.1 geranylgeranylglycerol-phosphate geranylgeranyltransferase [Salinarchaeum sp. IM2453]
METIRGLVEITRPVNALVAGVLTFIGAFVAAGVPADIAAVGAAVGATVLATGAGNGVNDYFDREIDEINAPDRPIPRGAVSPTQALVFSIALMIIAVLLALTLPLPALIIAGINLIALLTYTSVFKGLPGAGNVIVAGLGGSTFLFGAGAIGQINWTVGALFLLAALATLSREIVKDVEDIEGDREEDLYTLPMAIGERKAIHLSNGLLAIAILASPMPYLQGALEIGYLVVLVPAVALLGYAGYRSYDDPTIGQIYMKYAMFAAAVAFIVGRLTVVLS